MPVKLADLSKKFGLSSKDLKKKLVELGVSLKPLSRSVEDDIAAKLEEAIKGESATEEDAAIEGEKNTVKIYEEFIEKELDKEIIKSQRKMTAGKETPKPKKTHAQTIAVSQPTVIPSEVEIPDAITVKEFSEKTCLNPVKVIGELMKNGILANINQTIDFETASIIASFFNITLKRKRSEARAEDISAGNLEMLLKEEDEKELQTRPPIVTVMGHVDHGKTKLLDAIRETDVVSTEAGGITQQIGAYQVEKNGRKITFIDTPGHEAFTAMRARGAKITDIVVLVVAADEGIKPQTIEALNHARDAGVSIIVALNKIDKEEANIDRVKAQLAEQGLQPEDWGGKTIMVPVSALTGQGIPLLLEMILLVADMQNLRANHNRPAVATVLEAHLDKNLGPVATVVVNTGTLRIGDAFVIGNICARVKAMKNYVGHALKFALPSTPVQVAGLDAVPVAGDIVQAVASLDEARQKAAQISFLREQKIADTSTQGIEGIISALHAGKLKTLKTIVKADALGSLEALKLSLLQVKKDEVSLKIIHSGVGAITESDVMMALAGGGIVVGFNTTVSTHVRQLAQRHGVPIFLHKIIYHLIEDLKKLLSGLLEPEVKEVTLGQAVVKQIFMTSKKSMIVGCKVMSGKIENKTNLRVLRDDKVVADGFISSLKRINDVVASVNEGQECGIKFEGDFDLQVGDILESWKQERTARFVT